MNIHNIIFYTLFFRKSLRTFGQLHTDQLFQYQEQIHVRATDWSRESNWLKVQKVKSVLSPEPKKNLKAHSYTQQHTYELAERRDGTSFASQINPGVYERVREIFKRFFSGEMIISNDWAGRDYGAPRLKIFSHNFSLTWRVFASLTSSTWLVLQLSHASYVCERVANNRVRHGALVHDIEKKFLTSLYRGIWNRYW